MVAQVIGAVVDVQFDGQVPPPSERTGSKGGSKCSVSESESRADDCAAPVAGSVGPPGFTRWPEKSKRASVRSRRFKHHQHSTRRPPRETRIERHFGGRGEGWSSERAEEGRFREGRSRTYKSEAP